MQVIFYNSDSVWSRAHTWGTVCMNMVT